MPAGSSLTMRSRVSAMSRRRVIAQILQSRLSDGNDVHLFTNRFDLQLQPNQRLQDSVGELARKTGAFHSSDAGSQLADL